MRAERLSKQVIALWAVAAVLIEFYYASPGWTALRTLGPLLLLGFAALAEFEPRSVSLIAAAPYLFPAGLFLVTGEYHVHYTISWLAAMLGAVLPDALRRGWHTPARWSVPLACWAGVVAVTAPIVVLRSTDFQLELLTRSRLSHEALGGFTPQGIAWIGHVALLVVIGILWFDRLLAAEPAFFRRWVAAPMASSSLVVAAVAVYQMRDLSFLSPTLFAGMGRATSTMFDANIAGAIIACWIGGWALLLLPRRGRWPLLLVPIALLLWAGVWATSSRTAFASAVLITMAVLWTVLRSRVSGARALAALAAASVVLALGAAILVTHLHSTAVGPLERFASMSRALASPGAARQVLWDRDGYGVVANAMIADYPLFGVGIGTFHEMTGRYQRGLVADNAQNWYRHQFAELGLIGSLGWIGFVALFAWWVVRRHPGEAPGALIARSILVAFALISLVGMPGQGPAIAITFWTIAAWYVHLAGAPQSTPAAAPARTWIAALAIVAVAAAGVLVLSRRSLRPPVLAQRAAFDEYAEYTYGFWPPEDDGNGEFRWAGKRATIVVPVNGRQFTLSLTSLLPDLAMRPVHVQAWVDGRSIIDTKLSPIAPVVEKTVLLPAGERRVLVETATDRSATAPPPDGRELALQVRWSFGQLH